MADIHQRIAAVHQALFQGIDSKLTQFAASSARAHLQRAYEAAHAEPKLPPPWPAITSYRLAHLQLRTARSAAELEQVEALLVEAQHGDRDLLGPLPRLYRLMVRLRLGVADQEFFARTVNAITQTSPLSAAAGSDRPAWAGPLQNHLINQLETLAYVGGFDYAPLEGLASDLRNPFADLGLGDGWRLIGGEPQPAPVLMPQPLARAQFEALAGSNCWLFEWHDAVLHCDPPGGSERTSFSLPSWGGLLALLLANGSTARQALNRHADSLANLRQQILRLKFALVDVLGCSNVDIYATTEPEIRLAPALPVRGLIRQHQLEQFHRRYLGA